MGCVWLFSGSLAPHRILVLLLADAACLERQLVTVDVARSSAADEVVLAVGRVVRLAERRRRVVLAVRVLGRGQAGK